MGVYRAKDLLRVPSLLSLTRIPLGVCFVLALNHPLVELAILAVSGLTDIADGWWARRYGQTTATGAVVDPLTDKLFVLTVVVALITSERLATSAVVLLATREIGELPLVLWWTLSRPRRRAKAEDPRANIPGKIATCAQFLAIALALFRSPYTSAAVWLAAAAGVVAAASYWVRDRGLSRNKKLAG